MSTATLKKMRELEEQNQKILGKYIAAEEKLRLARAEAALCPYAVFVPNPPGPDEVDIVATMRAANDGFDLAKRVTEGQAIELAKLRKYVAKHAVQMDEKEESR